MAKKKKKKSPPRRKWYDSVEGRHHPVRQLEEVVTEAERPRYNSTDRRFTHKEAVTEARRPSKPLRDAPDRGLAPPRVILRDDRVQGPPAPESVATHLRAEPFTGETVFPARTETVFPDRPVDGTVPAPPARRGGGLASASIRPVAANTRQRDPAQHLPVGGVIDPIPFPEMSIEGLKAEQDNIETTKSSFGSALAKYGVPLALGGLALALGRKHDMGMEAAAAFLSGTLQGHQQAAQVQFQNRQQERQAGLDERRVAVGEGTLELNQEQFKLKKEQSSIEKQAERLALESLYTIGMNPKNPIAQATALESIGRMVGMPIFNDIAGGLRSGDEDEKKSYAKTAKMLIDYGIKNGLPALAEYVQALRDHPEGPAFVNQIGLGIVQGEIDPTVAGKNAVSAAQVANLNARTDLTRAEIQYAGVSKGGYDRSLPGGSVVFQSVDDIGDGLVFETADPDAFDSSVKIVNWVPGVKDEINRWIDTLPPGDPITQASLRAKEGEVNPYLKERYAHWIAATRRHNVIAGEAPTAAPVAPGPLPVAGPGELDPFADENLDPDYDF